MCQLPLRWRIPSQCVDRIQKRKQSGWEGLTTNPAVRVTTPGPASHKDTEKGHLEAKISLISTKTMHLFSQDLNNQNHGFKEIKRVSTGVYHWLFIAGKKSRFREEEWLSHEDRATAGGVWVMVQPPPGAGRQLPRNAVREDSCERRSWWDHHLPEPPKPPSIPCPVGPGQVPLLHTQTYTGISQSIFTLFHNYFSFSLFPLDHKSCQVTSSASY